MSIFPDNITVTNNINIKKTTNKKGIKIFFMMLKRKKWLLKMVIRSLQLQKNSLNNGFIF